MSMVGSERLWGLSVGNSFNLGIKLNNVFPLKMSASLINTRIYKSTSKMNKSESTEHESTEKSWEELIAELRGSRTFTEMQEALESGKGWGDLAMEEEGRNLEERTARLSGQVAELTEVEKRLASMAAEEDRYRRSSGFTYATWRQRRQALLEQRAVLTAAVGETAAATARSAAAAATLAAQAAAQAAAQSAARAAAQSAVRAVPPAPVSAAALQRELESLPTARELSRPPWTQTAAREIEQQRRNLMQRLAAARATVRAPVRAPVPAPQSRFAALAEESDSDGEYEADARLGI
jgi:chromosome segregation ATPase